MIRAALLALMVAATGAAADVCRQALALGLDVSGSVDAREYRLQMDGLADALDSVAVRTALLERPDTPVELLVFEWSGPADQMTLVPWTRVVDGAAVDGIIATLRGVERRGDATPGTALGVAMTLGVQHLSQRAACWRRVLDISGDGKSNLGPRPRDVKTQLAARGVTINALVIGADDPAAGDARQGDIAELSAYFTAEVIVGPDAFVETALGFEDYARAMETKLLRELGGMVLSGPPLRDSVIAR
ncbi:DUF1194 domain-containing protein [Sulfitobacter sp. S190]|uniref:DUF1194 domain-containing protein n=1 Tax=Sulfitobacter sp. S190 TaxID=2867022 RepID=UPI0021A75943|nr:DUF1194 domain-containing protein [Sulfitobacter sp. S190]UWR21480.1 DUF1194 domain-containing protein [Sulfitobacter sp. S190]